MYSVVVPYLQQWAKELGLSDLIGHDKCFTKRIDNSDTMIVQE